MQQYCMHSRLKIDTITIPNSKKRKLTQDTEQATGSDRMQILVGTETTGSDRMQILERTEVTVDDRKRDEEGTEVLELAKSQPKLGNSKHGMEQVKELNGSKSMERSRHNKQELTKNWNNDRKRKVSSNQSDKLNRKITSYFNITEAKK